MLLESMDMDSQLPLLVMPPSAPLLAPTLPELSMLPSVKLKLRLILLSFMEVMAMLVLDMPAMLDTLIMLLESMVMDSQLPLLVMPLSAPPLAQALLDLPPLPSPPLLVDMPVLDVMLLTPPELSMLPSVKLRLTLLFSMVVMAMLVLVMLAMLVTLIMLLESMVMDSQLLLPDMPMSVPLLAPALLDLLPLPSPPLLVDMPVLDVMSLTLPELFMLPKPSKF